MSDNMDEDIMEDEEMDLQMALALSMQVLLIKG